MLIKNARVFSSKNRFEELDIKFEQKILEIGAINGVPDIDAKGCYVIPGLVDIHTHGAAGHDASDGSAKGLVAMSRYYAQNGVTSFCATTMTLKEEILSKAMQAVRDFKGPDNGSRCVGVYLEGPFLSYGKRGAHAAEYLQEPDIKIFERLNKASGNKVKIVGLAPELPRSAGFIKHVSKQCAVSLAHTTADYDTAMQAIKLGATQVTHLFNGMNGFLHRDPGPVGAALDGGAYVELICDGLHIHPSIIRATFAMFNHRVLLISDSLRCAGLPDGNYDLGGRPILVNKGKATLLNGTLAGSSINLLDALQNAVSFGIPLEQAVASATILPARAIGLEESIGSLEVGKCADLLLLDSRLSLVKTIIDGRVVEAVDCADGAEQ